MSHIIFFLVCDLMGVGLWLLVKILGMTIDAIYEAYQLNGKVACIIFYEMSMVALLLSVLYARWMGHFAFSIDLSAFIALTMMTSDTVCFWFKLRESE